jgi:hypothetical protein
MTSVWPPASASAVYLRCVPIGWVPDGSSAPCAGACVISMEIGSPSASVHGA